MGGVIRLVTSWFVVVIPVNQPSAKAYPPEPVVWSPAGPEFAETNEGSEGIHK